MIPSETPKHQLSRKNVASIRSSKISNTRTNSMNKPFYNFHINSHQKNKELKHKSNHISTTKYNVITFLPKSFLLQFSRLPNIYFLFIAIIQSIPIISPLTSVTAILPLIFVLCVSMLRELVEDIARYKYDKLSNSRKVEQLKKGCLIPITSQNIEVGDIVIVNENEEFPCDMILLDSMNKEGIAYIETGSLDGEKTLKTKLAVKELKGKLYQNGEQLHLYEKIEGNGECDMPNPDLYRFDGKMQMNFDNEGFHEYPLTNSQLLLKGALLRQTTQVIGICIYTGHNNKILLNSKNPKMKLSHLEHLMSKLLIVIFFIQLILCAICAVIHKQHADNHVQFYINFIFTGKEGGKMKNESFISFFTYLLLLNTMIPISLIVTLEIVKVIQGFFIGFDCELYSHLRKKFCSANSVSIIEELGKVNYIFSDKTGTLTCNKMQFKYCVIGDICYEYVSSENKDQRAIISSEEENMKDNQYNNDNTDINFGMKANNIVIYNSNKKVNNPLPEASSNGNITDKSRISLLQKNNDNRLQLNLNSTTKIYDGYMSKFIFSKSEMSQQIIMSKEFWYALSIGNECMTIEDKSGNISYNGLSPDDIELVKAASKQGFTLLKSPNDQKIIRVDGKIEKYNILNLIGFTSDRKRMSIIVQMEGSDEIKMYMKGADSEIKKRLTADVNFKHLTATTRYTDFYSSKGFRTLFVAMKTIPKRIYDEWSEKLRRSELDLENKSKLITQCYNEIENDMTLLGATIVEDKLQDKVPETIRDLRNAGIKIWMLTGDKIDTAENISLSCNLISKSHKCFKISPLTKKRQKTMTSELKTRIPELNLFLREFGDFATNPESTPLYSLLIESSILGKIFADEDSTENFMRIALRAESVVCCRVSPLQKALVVKHVKEIDKNNIALSIGDGGNDVSMILEAHVGIGIHGEEGMLAVQSSDFAIGEFKYLRRLLFFHGRNSLNRTSQMILYFFYKNFVFTILQFYFAFYNIASGQSLIDDWYITLFNLLFTALPLGVQALSNFDILESDGEIAHELMPLMYYESNYDGVFTLGSFTGTIFKAILFSVINYFFVVISVDESAINDKGELADIWYNSLSLYTNIIYMVSFSLLISQTYFIWIIPLVMIITTFGLYYAFCYYVNGTIYFNSNATIPTAFGSCKFYMNLILIVFTCFIFEFLIHSARIVFSKGIANSLMRMRKGENNKELIKTAKALKELANDKSDNAVINEYGKTKEILEEKEDNISLNILNQKRTISPRKDSPPKRSNTTKILVENSQKRGDNYLKKKTFDMVMNGGEGFDYLKDEEHANGDITQNIEYAKRLALL